MHAVMVLSGNDAVFPSFTGFLNVSSVTGWFQPGKLRLSGHGVTDSPREHKRVEWRGEGAGLDPVQFH